MANSELCASFAMAGVTLTAAVEKHRVDLFVTSALTTKLQCSTRRKNIAINYRSIPLLAVCKTRGLLRDFE